MLLGACAGSGATSPVPFDARRSDAAACSGQGVEKTVELSASDKMVVHGTLYHPCAGTPVPIVVLAHQMCRDRREWSAAEHDWVSALATRGVATLALDLRGHGKSLIWPDGTTHDLCQEIADPSVQSLYAGMVEDVRAAVSFARGEAKAGAVALVGSSIGANSALVVAATELALSAVIALSPGLDYRGVKTEEATKSLGARRALMVAAEDDPRSADAVRALKTANAQIVARLFATGGHGNAILVAHPAELADEIAWLTDSLLGSGAE